MKKEVEQRMVHEVFKIIYFIMIIIFFSVGIFLYRNESEQFVY
ncbi:hypothetical protein ACFL27_27605 [candidate division CSSED10-310 bacterium]|uniref:Uncharacterized protein n=1 Tax=candidate division CSSED10-310 bacterium TaxID=2855610 RepID=A0ABV6Z695_UNCC1